LTEDSICIKDTGGFYNNVWNEEHGTLEYNTQRNAREGSAAFHANEWLKKACHTAKQVYVYQVSPPGSVILLYKGVGCVVHTEATSVTINCTGHTRPPSPSHGLERGGSYRSKAEEYHSNIILTTIPDGFKSYLKYEKLLFYETNYSPDFVFGNVAIESKTYSRQIDRMAKDKLASVFKTSPCFLLFFIVGESGKIPCIYELIVVHENDILRRMNVEEFRTVILKQAYSLRMKLTAAHNRCK